METLVVMFVGIIDDSILRGQVANNCRSGLSLTVKNTEFQRFTGNSGSPVTSNASCVETGTDPQNHAINIENCSFEPSGPTIFSGAGLVMLSQQKMNDLGGTRFTNPNVIGDLPSGASYIVSVTEAGGVLTVTTAGPHGIPSAGAPATPCVAVMGWGKSDPTEGGWESTLSTLYTPTYLTPTTFSFTPSPAITNFTQWDNAHGVIWGGLLIPLLVVRPFQEMIRESISRLLKDPGF